MHGLSEKYDRAVEDAVIIHGGRTSMDIRVFEESFIPAFSERVLGWAATHTKYRASGTLPPADPEYRWECTFCPFEHRCGESDQPFSDIGVTGFLPLVEDYPRERIVKYLPAHAETGAKLTPTLAHVYPELAEECGVYDRQCSRCESEHAWDAVQWDADTSNPPVCPDCAGRSVLETLRGPSPTDEK
jgi:hypothetical protein